MLDARVILALDIGNSAVKAALVSANIVSPVLRSSVNSQEDASDLVRRIRGDRERIRIGMSSVVPRVSEFFYSAIESLEMDLPVVVSASSRLPFKLAYETPASLGADRIAAAVGGWHRGRVPGKPLIVIDAGTATTLEVIDRDGVYLGGPILSGPDLIRTSLSRGTAQLPEIQPSAPASAIGRNTETALQAGVMLGFVEGIRGIVGRVMDEVGRDSVVLVTGGWGALLSEHLGEIREHRPNLVLEGVARVVEAT